jgi:hypothetical protein
MTIEQQETVAFQKSITIDRKSCFEKMVVVA